MDLSSPLDQLLVDSARDYAGLDEDLRTQRLGARMFGWESKPIRLGRYELRRELAQGAMGLVFVAYDQVLERDVVLKMVQPWLRNDAGHRARLVREAHTLARLDHPNVVTVFDVVESDGELLITMALVDGPNLREWVAEACPPLREITTAYLEAGSGLAAAHAAGVVHRDVKPENLVMGADGRTRVIDFGLAQAGARGRDRERVGTYSYMAPEQARGEACTPQSDQYSWAKSLLHGLEPGGSLPIALRRVLERATQPDPARRWPSMELALAELERVVAPTRWTATRIGLLALGGSAAVAGAVALIDRPPPGCRGAGANLNSSWTETERGAIETGLTRSSRPHAAETAGLVLAELDRYVERWNGSLLQACETEASERISAGLLCLRGRRVEFETMTAALADRRPDEADQAVEAVLSLSSPASCANPGQYETAPARADLEIAVDRLARARATEGLGADEESIEMLETLLAETPTAGSESFVAAMQLDLAESLVNVARYEDAESVLYSARSLADQAEHRELEARARAKLANVLSRYTGRPSAALALLAALARPSDDELSPTTAAGLFESSGLAHHQAGDIELAVDPYKRAQALREASGDAHALAAVRANLAATLAMSGRLGEAAPVMESALESLVSYKGATHPETADICVNLGFLYLLQDRPADARRVFTRARTTMEANFGAEHPPLAHALAGLGHAALRIEDFKSARSSFERALTIARPSKELGPRHSGVEFGLAKALLAEGAPGEARAAAQRALERAEREEQPSIDAKDVRAWINGLE